MMVVPKKYKYKGEKLTLAEWAKKLGMTYSALQMRIAHGWPMAKVFSTPLQKKRKPHRRKHYKHTYNYRGESLSAAGWAKKLGIKKATFLERVRRTKDEEEIFRPGVIHRKRGKKYTYDGVSLDLDGWAAALGVSRNLLYKRVREGLPPSEIFAPQGKRKRGRPPKNREPLPVVPPEEQKIEGPLKKAVTSGDGNESVQPPDIPIPKKHRVASQDFLRGMAEGIWLTISAVAMMMAESGGDVAGKNLKRLEEMFKGGFAERFASVVAKDKVKPE